MSENYTVLDVEWDCQKVKYDNGKKAKLIRGIDYDPNWVKLGEGFAKKGKEITLFDARKYAKMYHVIDFATFELILSYNTTTNYFKDKKNVYLDSYMNRGIVILEDADPKDFKILDIKNGFSTSGTVDYHYNEKIPFRIKDAFIYEGTSYQKVNNSIYFAFRKIMNCDVKTFQLIDTREWHKTVFKDKDHVYHKGEIVKDADPSTFHFLENCIDENRRPRYTDCDIHYYAKDKNYAYFVNSPFEIKRIKTKDIEGFDFKVLDSEGYAFDKDYIYYRGVRKKQN